MCDISIGFEFEWLKCLLLTHRLFAKVAYGLGIDFPNIRRVYHLAAPALAPSAAIVARFLDGMGQNLVAEHPKMRNIV